LPLNKDINKFLDRHLINIKKPGRYTGGEFNQVKKDWATVSVKFALAFPDIYDIGFSNLGLAILYDAINQRDDALAERLYAPWPDMEALLRENDFSLFSLENRRPVKEFDILGFSIPYESLFTNVINMLDLSGIPIRSNQRGEDDPIVIAGGHASFNPEPMSAFIDAFVIGEGEEIIHEIIDRLKSVKEKGVQRGEIIDHLSGIDGIYVPKHFKVEVNEYGKIISIQNTQIPAKTTIIKRFVRKLPPPITNFLVPNIRTVQDRVVVEIMRGCSRGCRFCQAGMITRPVRERDPDVILQAVEEAVKNTGYEEVSLLSLSTSDYSQIIPLLNRISTLSKELAFEFSLPSLRIESFSGELMQEMEGKRKGNFTIAPESASEDTRQSINKPISDTDLFKTVEDIFRMGWRNLKLYFMVGFPGESLQDAERIADLCLEVNQINKRILKGRGKIHVSVNTLIPKPHTAFQWSPFAGRELVMEKYQMILNKLRRSGIKIDWPDYDSAFFEAVLSRGDRRVADVIETAWKMGAHFDSWQEFFNYSLWEKAFQTCGLDPEDYAYQERKEDEILPWDHIFCGVTKKYLYDEFLRSEMLQLTKDCRDGCSNCGIQAAYAIVCNEIRTAG
jgi:radical SAM family uncharacterized protein